MKPILFRFNLKKILQKIEAIFFTETTKRIVSPQNDSSKFLKCLQKFYSNLKGSKFPKIMILIDFRC